MKLERFVGKEPLLERRQGFAGEQQNCRRKKLGKDLAFFPRVVMEEPPHSKKPAGKKQKQKQQQTRNQDADGDDAPEKIENITREMMEETSYVIADGWHSCAMLQTHYSQVCAELYHTHILSMLLQRVDGLVNH